MDLIKFDKTNLSVQEAYKIIASNKKNTPIALLYDNENKIYLSSDNVIIYLTKYISYIK